MTQRVIDLTYPIHEGMTTFPGLNHPRVEVTILARHGIDGRETRRLVLGTHAGTHCDAPRHFVPGGGTVEDLDLDLLVGPATVACFAPAEDLTEIGAADLERTLGRDFRGARVLLRFDWPRRWGQLAYYTRSPFLSGDACRWLMDRDVRLIGMDIPSPDNPAHSWESGNDSPNHHLLLGHGVILVEYLCNLDQIRARTVRLIALPLKVLGADGAPARVIAIEETA